MKNSDSFATGCDKAPACPYVGGDAGPWRGPYEYRNPAGSMSFEVHVEHPLEAERIYTFRFCSISAADTAVVDTFRTEAVDLLDREIARMSVNAIGVVEARSLRNQLCDALKTSLESDQILAVGSLFDCSTEDPRRLETFRLRLSDIFLPQLNLQLVKCELRELRDIQRRNDDLPRADYDSCVVPVWDGVGHDDRGGPVARKDGSRVRTCDVDFFARAA